MLKITLTGCFFLESFFLETVFILFGEKKAPLPLPPPPYIVRFQDWSGMKAATTSNLIIIIVRSNGGWWREDFFPPFFGWWWGGWGWMDSSDEDKWERCLGDGRWENYRIMVQKVKKKISPLNRSWTWSITEGIINASAVTVQFRKSWQDSSILLFVCAWMPPKLLITNHSSQSRKSTVLNVFLNCSFPPQLETLKKFFFLRNRKKNLYLPCCITHTKKKNTTLCFPPVWNDALHRNLHFLLS